MSKVKKGNQALKIRRESTGFTQVQIAEKVGISERCYQRYESGERIPDVYRAQLIAKVLNSTVDEMFCL